MRDSTELRFFLSVTKFFKKNSTQTIAQSKKNSELCSANVTSNRSDESQYRLEQTFGHFLCPYINA